MDYKVLSQNKVIYISGTGRSGTNILKKVLDQLDHTIALPFETRFQVDPRGVLEFYNTFPTIWSPYWVDYKIKELEQFLLSLAQLNESKIQRTAKAKEIDQSGLLLTPPSYSGWELNKWIPGYTEFVKTLINDLIEFRYSGVWPGAQEGVSNHEMYFTSSTSQKDIHGPVSKFLVNCNAAICGNDPNVTLIDDNTHALLFANDLLNLVTNSKMIVIHRDPRDTISSLKQQRWAPKVLDQTVSWYTQVMARWVQQRETLNHDQYLEIQFEDFIQNPETILENICDFCQLEYQSEIQLDLRHHNIGRWETDKDALLLNALTFNK